MNNLFSLSSIAGTRTSLVRRFAIAGLCALAAALTCFALSGCSGSSADSANNTDSKDTKKVQVSASFYPMYDFAQKIGGDRVEVSCLVTAGTEPHDWEPSTTDIAKLSNADVLVYNGAGMEHWIDDTLASLSSSHLVAVEASKGVTLRELSEEADEHEHAHEEHAEGNHDDHNHDHSGTDPHVWLNPQNAKIEMGNIRDALIQADPDGADVYRANYDKWAAECDTLDNEFKTGLANVAQRSIVVSHEAFGYLCDAYNLTQMPIEGIEADSEPDAKEMAEIAEFVKEHNVKTIFSEELVSPKVAQAIAQETGAQTAELNPVEGLTDEQLAAGEDYFSTMRDNLTALKEALS